MNKNIVYFILSFTCLFFLSCGNATKQTNVEYSEELVKRAEQGDVDAQCD